MTAEMIAAEKNVLTLPKPKKERLYTLAEYLEKEEKSEKKHFFLNGKIINMPGGTSKHAFVAANFLYEVKNAIKSMVGEKPQYHYAGSDLKIWIPEKESVFYPDALVICEPVIHLDNRDDIILNPLVIVEVLSSSTRIYDQTWKFFYYKTIPSFREYVLVEPDRACVSSFYLREPNLWEEQKAVGLESSIHLKAIDVHIPLAGIYEGIKL